MLFEIIMEHFYLVIRRLEINIISLLSVLSVFTRMGLCLTLLLCVCKQVSNVNITSSNVSSVENRNKSRKSTKLGTDVPFDIN